MFKSPKFIVFEGLDGSGKSTCAKSLSKAIGAELLTTPSVAVRRFRDELVASFGSCQEARQLFYLSTVFAASERVAALLDAGRSVVVDRYFLSTQAYAAFRGSSLQVDALEAMLTPADMTFYMDTPRETRIARLNLRGANDADRETISVPADAYLRRAHLSRANQSVAGKFCRMDSGTGTPYDVLHRVLAMLGRTGW